jgi:hypothetical protein
MCGTAASFDGTEWRPPWCSSEMTLPAIEFMTLVCNGALGFRRENWQSRQR